MNAVNLKMLFMWSSLLSWQKINLLKILCWHVMENGSSTPAKTFTLLINRNRFGFHKILFTQFRESTAVCIIDIVKRSIFAGPNHTVVCTQQLERVQTSLCQKGPALVTRKKVQFLIGTARFYTANVTLNTITALEW